MGNTLALPALTPSTIRERNRYWRASLRRAERDRVLEQWTGVNEIASGGVMVLPAPKYTGLLPARVPSLHDGHWLAVKDGDPRAWALLDRHYSARHYRDGRRRTVFVGPGEKMVLLTDDCTALFIWRKFISMDNQTGVNCAAFRNEGYIKSSLLIREAVALAWERWPGQRLYTYVNPRKITNQGMPGFCFIAARWKFAGLTKRGLLIFERLPQGYQPKCYPLSLPLPTDDVPAPVQAALWEA